jgi:prolyl oligopeptidase
MARKDTVVENFHGTSVADPYRWMENENASELKTWIDQENSITNGYLESFPDRPAMKRRLTAMWNFERFSGIFKRGKKVFYYKNDGLQNQPVLYVKDSPKAKPTIVIDPNALSDDGTVALSDVFVSFDGTMMAYALSSSGSDWQIVRIRNLSTGKDYTESLQWTKFVSVAWKKDGKGFFYNRFPDPKKVPADQQAYNNKVYYHAIGTPQTKDELVYERPDAKELSFSPSATDDGDYLILSVWKGTDQQNRVYYRPMSSKGKFIKLLDKADAQYTFVDNMGPFFYFQTDLKAPKGKVIAIDINIPDPKRWRTIVPEQKEPIASVALANLHLVVTYLKDVRHILKLYMPRGRFIREVTLPAPGTISELWGSKREKEMFVTFESFLYPKTVFKYIFKDQKLEPVFTSTVPIDPSRFETKQVFYPLKDGTKIPMFIVSLKNIKLDGSNPVYLYGYGGFSVNIMPSFSIARMLWLEQGGVFALANIRGGAEYGEAWHQAGMLGRKQNVFDDFIAAGEWLIANKYTTSSKLAIAGGSNGGLLVSACMLQRPELFGAVICQVPVTDMLRYHTFTIGRYWTGEYGNARENADQFKFMYAYSPLHNVKSGVAYPPTLMTTADHDDRVVPAHSFKFAATMQAADAGKNPILVRIETKAGHGGGKPTAKRIDENVDIYSFLFKVFGMRMK